MKFSDSTKNLIVALVKAQAGFESAKKTANNPLFKTKYADLAEVIDAVKKPLSDNGLAFVQTVEPNAGGTYVLKTVLFHSSGESMSSEYPIFVKSGDAQGFGAGVTYARRYALQTLLGIPADDDDGNAASGTGNNNKPQGKSATSATPPSTKPEVKPAAAASAKPEVKPVQQAQAKSKTLTLEEIGNVEGVIITEDNDNIVVSGKTFALSNDLRGLGFSWNGQAKNWFKQKETVAA
jgi:hypothetical protein